MTIVSFNLVLHSKHISNWLSKRDLKQELLNDLPALGLIGFNEEDKPIAAGFIRQCEGNVGLVDSFITDPEAKPSERHEILNLLTTRLIDMAREHKLKGLIAISEDFFTIERSIKHGFKKLPTMSVVSISFGE